ncbi:hypothetical protein GTQ99_02395 [Kineococcus sp. T13]|uniref:hypothetical protein n=1 Tax=Kineococcus vitellinus TaxID=2696565 RepID=UPI0014129C8A|nr:hypothetical protein [Kineococcus vitellinus]NAZ74278.1 hypothetical protein [Kineococcus vitellinus]
MKLTIGSPDTTSAIEFPHEGIYDARLDRCEEKTITRRDATPFSLLNWYFTVTGPDARFTGRRVRGTTTTALRRYGSALDRRLNGWLTMIYGDQLSDGMVIDTENLTGLTFRVTIAMVPDRKDPRQRWAEVTDIHGVSPDPSFVDEQNGESASDPGSLGEDPYGVPF